MPITSREPACKHVDPTVAKQTLRKSFSHARALLYRSASTRVIVTILASLIMLCALSKYSSLLSVNRTSRWIWRASRQASTHDAAASEDLITTLERWKDPDYANSRLSIYVYDLPSRFNTDLVKASKLSPPQIRDPYCDSNFYSSEVHVHRHLLNSSVRTTDPHKANFFYVPIYTTCDLISKQPNDLVRTGRNFHDAMQYVMNDYPHWNASNGRDHIFLFAQGFSARLAGDWTSIKNAIFMVHNGEFTAPEYTPHKDFTIPPELQFYFRPIWRVDQHTASERTYLAQFGGQVVNQRIADHRGSNYSRGVRQFIQSYLKDDPEYRVTGVRSSTYLDDMKRSKFCLAPEGWHPWSPRPYYAIQMGCIPVIISEVQELAFEEFVDWDSFAVWVRPSEITNLDTILHNLSDKEIEEKQAAMRKVWRVFWYEGDDALGYQAILQALYSRKWMNHPRRIFSTVNLDDY